MPIEIQKWDSENDLLITDQEPLLPVSHPYVAEKHSYYINTAKGCTNRYFREAIKMKLYYIDQRKVFPFLQPVELWDEQGNVRYLVKSKCTIGLQLRLLTPYDEEAASIRQKILGTKFIVKVNDKELTVSLKTTLKGERYCVVSDLNWKAEGFLGYRTYQITAEDQLIAQVQMVEFSKGKKDALYEALKKIAHVPLSALDQGNCCEIFFSDDQNEAEVLAVVMGIEAALCVGRG